MTVAEKKQLRMQALKDLYEFNEKHPGRHVNITFTDLQNDEDDKQKHLAYQYLEGKGLIEYAHSGGGKIYSAKINSYGIDEFENQQ